MSHFCWSGRPSSGATHSASAIRSVTSAIAVQIVARRAIDIGFGAAF